MILVYLCRNFVIVLKFVRFELLRVVVVVVVVVVVCAADSRLLGYGTVSRGK